MRNETATLRARAAAILWLAAVLVANALGCASTSPERQQITDSLEPMNRSLFGLNEMIDDYGFGPTARGFKRITPGPLRLGLVNAEHNLGFPARFVASLGQGKLTIAGSELGRFLLNSTLGMGGLLDPASEVLPKYDEDLGLMLASWHVPPGPYLLLPVFGPSTQRDAVADLVAMAMNPLMWTTAFSPPVSALFAINRRAEADDLIRTGRESALDYYVFVRDAFIQRRTRQVLGDSIVEDPMSQPEDAYDLPEAEPSASAR